MMPVSMSVTDMIRSNETDSAKKYQPPAITNIKVMPMYVGKASASGNLVTMYIQTSDEKNAAP